MKYLVELIKSIVWFLALIGTPYLGFQFGYLAGIAVLVVSGLLIFWAADWLDHQDYLDRLNE